MWKERMFGLSPKFIEQVMPLPPQGISEIIICIFDDKKRLRYKSLSRRGEEVEEDSFPLLRDPVNAFDSFVVREAVASQSPVSIAFTYGAGRHKYLYVLPYKRKKGRLYFACVQIVMESNDSSDNVSHVVSALSGDRACLLLVDQDNTVLSAGSRVPEAFGFDLGQLDGMQLANFFTPIDLTIIKNSDADTNESVIKCVFRCVDGSRRDVEIFKFSSANGCYLYGIFDVSRPTFNEEITQVSTRERRRIGQDLHDSIGQLLTGMSLLSRSLANELKRDGCKQHEDAAQISELADDASNQIRQISRGLMLSEVVHHGLFASLCDLAEVIKSSCGMQCEVQIDETVNFVDGAVETHLFRIAQEAVNNSVRHSGASRIDIHVSQAQGRPKLVVQDNGTWKGNQDIGNGVGMKTMEYRASVIGGKLQVGPTESGGTQVVCHLEKSEIV